MKIGALSSVIIALILLGAVEETLGISCHQCKYPKDDDECWQENYNGTSAVCNGPEHDQNSCVTRTILEDVDITSSGKVVTPKVVGVVRECTPKGEKVSSKCERVKGSRTPDENSNITKIQTRSCYCTKDNCNIQSTIGTKCIQCQSKDDQNKSCLQGGSTLEGTECPSRPKATCELVLYRDFVSEGVTLYSRRCGSFRKTAKDGKCIKSFFGTTGSTICFCNDENCNKGTDLATLDRRTENDLYCQQCFHSRVVARQNENCYLGNVTATTCNRNGEIFNSCYTAVSFRITDHTTYVYVQRGCQKLDNKDQLPFYTAKISRYDREKTYNCFKDSCNYHSEIFHQKAAECLICDPKGSKVNCKESGYYIPKVCPASVSLPGDPKPLSCYSTSDGSKLIGLGCSDVYHTTPFCEKVADNTTAIFIRCHCNGVSCNENSPPKDLISAAQERVLCLQCTHTSSSGNRNCLIGEGLPTICPNFNNNIATHKNTRCRTQVAKIKNKIETLTRDCNHDLKDKDCVLQGDDVHGIRTCYCTDDGCNNNNLEFSCRKCEYTAASPNDCWKGGDASTNFAPCEVGASKMGCVTSITREETDEKSSWSQTTKIVSIKRGCAPLKGETRKCVKTQLDKDPNTKVRLSVEDCYCPQQGCNNEAVGRSCAQCTPPHKYNCFPSGKHCAAFGGPQATCELVFSRDQNTDRTISLSRNCTQYNPAVTQAKITSCVKEIGTSFKKGISNVRCQCNSDDCNTAEEWKFSSLELTAGGICLQCEYLEKDGIQLTPEDVNCKLGTVTATSCNNADSDDSTFSVCVTTMITNPSAPHTIVGVIRGCDVLPSQSEANSCKTTIHGGLRKTSCTCNLDGCNDNPHTYLESFLQKVPECILCSRRHPNDEENCKSDNGNEKVWIPQLCPNSDTLDGRDPRPQSCLVNIYKDAKGSITFIERACSGTNQLTEFCSKKYSTDYGVYTYCHCSGGGCNQNLPSESLINQAGLMCTQCEYNRDFYYPSSSNTQCESGEAHPTLCTDDGPVKKVKSCKTQITINRKKEVESITRGCSEEDKDDECDEEVHKGNAYFPLSETTCYCKGDWCNTKKGSEAIPTTTQKPLEPLKCWTCEDVFSTEEDDSEDSDCRKAKNIPLKECTDVGDEDYDHLPGYSCFYTTFKTATYPNGVRTVKVAQVSRGCSPKGPRNSGQLFRDCTEQLEYKQQNGYSGYHRGETCYCFSNGCNRNTPEGLSCLQCDYSEEGCTEGTQKPRLCTQKYLQYFGAVAPSCRATKWEDNETGKLVGISRDCVDYTEDICKSPVKDGIYKKTSCFCNSEGCDPHKKDSSLGGGGASHIDRVPGGVILVTLFVSIWLLKLKTI